MKRTHIHLAQHYSHVKGAKALPGPYKPVHIKPLISDILSRAGLRNNSQVLVYIDLDRALQAKIPFFLSANGVVLSKGDESGYLRPVFFKVVTDAQGNPLPDLTDANTTKSEVEESIHKNADSIETRSGKLVSDDGFSGKDGGMKSPLQSEALPTAEKAGVESIADNSAHAEVKNS